MRKHPSRRRIKAKALRGQTIPWMWIVDHRLETWGEWERRFDFQDAYLLSVFSQRALEVMVAKASKTVFYSSKLFYSRAQAIEWAEHTYTDVSERYPTILATLGPE